jgi:hypothetical protein
VQELDVDSNVSFRKRWESKWSLQRSVHLHQKGNYVKSWVCCAHVNSTFHQTWDDTVSTRKQLAFLCVQNRAERTSACMDPAQLHPIITGKIQAMSYKNPALHAW